MADLEAQVRYRSSLVVITDVRCRAPRCGAGCEEAASAHEIVFPRAGVFVRHVGSEATVANPNHVLFFNAHEAYRISHPVAGGDDCTCFAFSRDVLNAALSEIERPFPLTHAVIPARAVVEQQRIRQRLSERSATALEIDERALNLLDSLAGARQPTYNSNTSATARLRAQWIEAVKLLIARDPGADLSLAAIGRAVHCSPFHLARLFRAAVGVSIHQYQLRLRLALALERFFDRGASLTEIALDLGFASHSHFSSTFRRVFGSSPSTFRRAATSARVHKLRTILKAA